jgi:hypothetical protein
MFEAEALDAVQRLRQAETARMEAQQQRFEAKKAAALADIGAWINGPYRERVEALIASMDRAGADARPLRDAILMGVNAAAKAGRLDEKHVAFVETKARVEVARVAAAGVAPPVAWGERAATDLEVACAQLPEPLLLRGLQRINDLGRRLGAMGFADAQEVTSSCSEEARGVARGIREVETALVVLAVDRYRAAKGYQNASAEHLERSERYATEVLGLETRRHPGVKADLPLTSSGLRTPPLKRRQVSAAQRDERARPAAPSAMYVGRIVAMDEASATQKVGRGPTDLVRHSLADLSGHPPRVGEVVSISYAMGIGHIAAPSVEKSGPRR